MKHRTLAGIVLLFAGLGCFGSGGLILREALDRQATNTEQARRADVACREQLVKLGRLTPREDVYEVELSDVKDPRRALGDATAALAMCPGRTLVDACMGSACSNTPGPVRMVLKLGRLK